MKTSKKHIILFFLLSILLFPTSCGNDFLDRQPLDGRTREGFFRTEAEVLMSLNATYWRLRSPVIGGMGNGNASSVDIEALTDNAWTGSGGHGFNVMAQGNHTAANPQTAGTMWTHCWQGISNCNFFLDNLARPEVRGLLDEATYRRFRGEALFLRSFYYHLLLEHFGDIPWVDTWVTADMPFFGMPRLPKAQVVGYILRDLEEAINLLPLPAAGFTDGRAIQSSAIMLKVRVLMANHRFQEAITTARRLINNPANPHRIVDCFEGIFFGNQRNNREIIFGVLYNGGEIDLHSFDFFTATRQSNYPLANLAAAFGTRADGTPDPRLRFTMFIVGDPWTMNTIGGNNPAPGTVGTFTYPPPYELGTFTFAHGQFPAGHRVLGPGPAPGQYEFGPTPINADGSVPPSNLSWRKGVNPAGVDLRNNRSTQDRVLMRYADLLLLYAEAHVEVGGGTTTDAGALAAFNAVRTRPSVGMPTETMLTREMVRNERRVELAYEGIRLYDILRWDIGHEVVTTVFDADGWVISGKSNSLSRTRVLANARRAGSNGVVVTPAVWRGNLWPIPLGVMELMPHWEQNYPF